MLYYEFDDIRVEWNGSKTFNVQIPIGGQWVDIHCTENHNMDHTNMDEVTSNMIDVYNTYINEETEDE